MISQHLIGLLIAVFAHATWAGADTVDVDGRGAVDLTPFDCTDSTRSSVIDRVCYDEARRFAIIAVRTRYRPYCNVPKATLDAFAERAVDGAILSGDIGAPDARRSSRLSGGGGEEWLTRMSLARSPAGNSTDTPIHSSPKAIRNLIGATNRRGSVSNSQTHLRP